MGISWLLIGWRRYDEGGGLPQGSWRTLHGKSSLRAQFSRVPGWGLAGAGGRCAGRQMAPAKMADVLAVTGGSARFIFFAGCYFGCARQIMVKFEMLETILAVIE